MRRRSWLPLAVLALIWALVPGCGRRPAPPLPAPPPEVHCKHFIYGCPAGTPTTNDFIIRDVYALSSNDDTKLADWVAYRLDRETVVGDAETNRRWRADPWLGEDETLEPDDYRDAHRVLGTDRGHQAPLGSFKGTTRWGETNYLSNITPQRSDLNQGPWLRLEEKVRELAESGETVYVITGPLFEREMRSLPRADEPHRVPSGYWKIVVVETAERAGTLASAAFIFDQETPGTASVIEHLVAIDEVERRSGLDFLWELPDGVEEQVEGGVSEAWARDTLIKERVLPVCEEGLRGGGPRTSPSLL